MKKLVVLLILVSAVAFGQSKRWLWVEPTGDMGRWLYDQGGGNMVVMGTERATGKALLHGLSAGGVSTWSTTVDSTRNPVLGIGQGGRLFVGGYFPYTTDDNAVMTALTAGGGRRWSISYDEPRVGDNERFQCITEGTQGTVFCAGIATRDNYSDIAVFAYDGTDGRLMDTTFYDGPDHYMDSPVDMACSDAGDVYVLGQTYAGDNSDWVMLQWNGSGGAGWTSLYNGPGNDDDYAYAMALSPAGNMYATGIAGVGGNNSDFEVISVQAASGQMSWSYRFPDAGGDASGRDVVVGADGNIYAVGQAADSSGFSSLVVTSLAPGGTERWTYRYAPRPMVTATASAIAWGADGNVYAFGSAINQSYNADMLVVSLTADGNQRWAYTEDGGHDDYISVGCGIYGDDGYVYAAGRIDETGQTPQMAVLSLNPAAGIEESPQLTANSLQPAATIARGVLLLPVATSHKPQAASWLLDVSGRKVLELHAGSNDISGLAPGAYILRSGGQSSRVLVVE
jgi:hypothetical protein